MIKIVTVFFFIAFFYCQKNIIVLTDSSSLSAFEREFLTNVLELYKKKHPNEYTFEFQNVDGHWSNLFEEFDNRSKANDYLCAIMRITITDERKQRYSFS